MLCDPNGANRVNSFALVTYIPDRLGSFLDRLRRELVPSCVPQAHVTILPPRPLQVNPEVAEMQVRAFAAESKPFRIEATEIEIFKITSVVYIAVGRGETELHALHDRFNTGDFNFPELFPYHPHITLAQQILPEEVEEIEQLARRRWAEFAGERYFLADKVALVQATLNNLWVDVESYSLGGVARV